MRKSIIIIPLLFLLGCHPSPEKQTSGNVDHLNKNDFFVGTIRTEGVFYAPLMKKEFEINYHFADSVFKYEYIESDKESGLIINYNSKTVTLYAREYDLKRKFTTSIAYFEDKYNDLEFFRDCVNRLFSRIKMPEYFATKIDYGNIQDIKFDLISYKDDQSKLDICDLKISIPKYVTAITFKDKPGEVQYFPLINQYKRELGLLEKILLKLNEIVINSTEITGPDPAESFTVPDGYELVDDIEYSGSYDNNGEDNTRGKSLFEKFD